MSNGNSFGNGDSMSVGTETWTLPYWFRVGLPVPVTLVGGL